jgi:hypothetical protein
MTPAGAHIPLRPAALDSPDLEPQQHQCRDEDAWGNQQLREHGVEEHLRT